MNYPMILASAIKAGTHLVFTCPVNLRAEVAVGGAEQGIGGTPPFEMLAYTGGLLRVKGFDCPVVVDLKGLTGTDKSLPILLDHDKAQRVGHTDRILNDGQSLTAAGLVSGTGPAAEEVRQNAKRKFPWQASIGAEVLQAERYSEGETALVNGRAFRGPVIVATRSLLREISFVAVGADDQTSVRVAAQAATAASGGKESTMTFEQWLKAEYGLDAATLTADQKAKFEAKFAESTATETEVEAGGEGDPAKKAAPVAPVQASGKSGINAADDVVKATRKAAADEARRIAAVTAAAAKFPEIQASAIEQGWTVERTELEVLRKDRPSAPAGHVRNIEASGIVLEASLAMTLGQPDLEKRYEPKVLEAAHKDFRNLGLQQVLMIAACANGYAGRVGERIHNGNVGDILLHALPGRMVKAGFSTVNLPGIFSNVANKELLLGYTEEDQTWREVAQIKSVNDFKVATSYRLLDNMEYEEVPAAGKIPHGTIGEESYTRQVKTFAKMFSLTRQDIINDDLGAFDDLRNRLGRGAAKKLNNVFWAEFMDNSTFYTSARGNAITGATTTLLVDGVGLQLALTAFRKLRTPVDDGQKRLTGDLVGGRPEILLVPPELEFAAQRLYQSTNVNTGGSSTAESVGNANIHANKYRPVVCNWLSDTNFTGNSTTAWYLFRSPRVMAPVVVSFLNGQQAPTVESAEADFNELGIQFRGYHDFGCDSAEYLAGVRSKGAA